MISVITITHNRSNFLKKAIDSVIGQTFTDFEYIIVDDGSDEPIAELIKSFSDPRIKYIRCERTGHLPSLRNAGLEEAAGKIICFLDNDDYWENSYLKTVFQKFEGPNLISIISNGVIEESAQSYLIFKTNFVPSSGRLLDLKLRDDGFVIYPSCFSFRNTLNLKFNPHLQFGDNDLFLRLLAMGNSEIMNSPLVHITKHSGNMSSANNLLPTESYKEEIFTLNNLFQAQLLPKPLYHFAVSKYAYKLANIYLQSGQKKSARDYFLQAFLHKPLHLKALIRFLTKW